MNHKTVRGLELALSAAGATESAFAERTAAAAAAAHSGVGDDDHDDTTRGGHLADDDNEATLLRAVAHRWHAAATAAAWAATDGDDDERGVKVNDGEGDGADDDERGIVIVAGGDLYLPHDQRVVARDPVSQLRDRGRDAWRSLHVILLPGTSRTDT